MRTFVLQIVGSSIGYLLDPAFLEMFKNVGGYHFNPYVDPHHKIDTFEGSMMIYYAISKVWHHLHGWFILLAGMLAPV